MHIYRDSPMRMNVLPAIPTRTSSLNPDLKEKSRRSPADIFERYMKSVYHPLDTAPPPVNTDLRHSFRGPTGHRSRATVINTTPPVNADQREARASSNSPPMYKIRARSNSFKENDKGGWITVGPEFSIKPAGGVQPVINVTILPTMKNAEMEYSGMHMVVPERIVSGTGGVNVQSMGSGHGKPPVLNVRNATVSASSSHPTERDGLYQIYTPLPPPAAVPPHAALPPTPAEKEKPRLTSLLRRRNSSMSRAHTPQLTGQPFQRTYSMNLKSALKKRSSSQSYFEPKKSVTFADYTTVYS